MSFGLVLLATILLVVGLLADDLTLIYISIAASITAAVVLVLAFRRARPEADTREAPTPIPPEGAEDEPEAVEPTTVTPAVPAAVTTRDAVVAAAEEPAEAEADEAEPVPAEEVVTSDPAASAADDDWTSDDDWADDGEFDVEFPIADYDDLTVAEIMPLLPQLYSDELGVVAQRERTGKNRTTILARLDELAATGTEADALEADLGADEAFAPEAAPAAAATTPTTTVPTPEEPRPAPRTSAPAPQVPSLTDDEGDDGYVFPIADYDELTVDQIVPLLVQLEDDELEDVKAREAAGQGRKSVIAEIDRQLGLVEAVDVDRDEDGWAASPEPADAPEARPAPEREAPEGSALAIAGYDGLTVAQIRPLLSGLSHRELRAVLEHEVARDNRRTIVTEIERRLAAEDEGAAAAPAAPAARTTKAAAKKATSKRSTAKRAARTTKAAAKKASRSKVAASPFPIADYDTLTVAKIRPQLAGLSESELLQVRAREERGAGRKTILNDIASRLG